MLMDKLSFKGPVVLVVMDGVGLSQKSQGNALAYARINFLRDILKNYLALSISASGEAVGLLPGQMGNSEVGHNTLGCGQILKQGTARIEDAFSTGKIWESDAWKGAIKNVKENSSTLHFSGIFSDGGVHSHIAHLEKMVARAVQEGVKKIRVHAIFDGRDVASQSEPKFINRFETFAENFPEADIKIASGGGRMTTVSDRYEEDWSRVERGWKMMVDGKSDHTFHSAREGIEFFRNENPKIQDQNLPDFVIVDESDNPVGKVEKGDSFIYFDFRADRAIEISMAFTYRDFPHFSRGNYSPDDIFFAGLTEYNSDTHVPEHRLVSPIEITDTLNNFLGEKGISQLAVSETVKFGHVTYYFNGNSYEKAKKEAHIEIKSGPSDYNHRPWMKAAEITDKVLENLENYRFVRLNFPNGDMVGHLAEMESSILAMEAIDLQLKRLAKKVDELGGVMLVTADHGNVEELLDENGKPKTAHTSNPIPFVIYDNTENRFKYELSHTRYPGLSNIASTVALLLGENDYPESWREPLIRVVE